MHAAAMTLYAHNNSYMYTYDHACMRKCSHSYSKINYNNTVMTAIAIVTIIIAACIDCKTVKSQN